MGSGLPGSTPEYYFELEIETGESWLAAAIPEDL